MQASDILHLKVMDQFVSCEVRVPSSRTNDDAECSDVVPGIACESEALCAFCRGAENVSRNLLNLPDPRLYESDRLVAKNQSLV